MGKLSSAFFLIFLIFDTGLANAQDLSLKWGLQNTWSYAETRRAEDEDLSIASKSQEKRYRAFAFEEKNPEVLGPTLKCFERHEDLWKKFRESTKQARLAAAQTKNKDPDYGRLEFQAYKAKNDPFCFDIAKKHAPRLYFDFTANSSAQYVLESIEITTLGFREYRGGGFAIKEARYDIILRHNEGVKKYQIEPQLVFIGVGRAELRFWSDNFYPQMGWMAPMGEYKIDIRFVFSAGSKTMSVRTGPFKIDV